MRRARVSLAEEWPFLIGGAAAAVWRWRLELVLVLVPVLGWRALADELGPAVAGAIVVPVLGAVVIPARGRLARWLRAAHVRRR